MKVKLELDPDQKETEITIHAGQLTPEIERIYQQLKWIQIILTKLKE